MNPLNYMRLHDRLDDDPRQYWENTSNGKISLLKEHPEGLTAEQIRGLLNAQKPIGDTLQGMRRGNLVRTEGTGREMRYFLNT